MAKLSMIVQATALSGQYMAMSSDVAPQATCSHFDCATVPRPRIGLVSPDPQLGFVCIAGQDRATG